MLVITTIRSAIILRLIACVVSVTVDIDPSTVVNVVNEEFVSFTIRADQVRSNGEQFETISSDWHPAHVRVQNDADEADADEMVAMAQLIGFVIRRIYG